MSPRLLAASALMALTGVVHVAMGGPEVYHPLLALTADPVLDVYLALLWHFVTVFFALGTFAFVWAAADPAGRYQTAACVAILLMGMGALFLGFGLVKLGDPWTTPQWTVALVIAGLVFWPARGARLA